MPVNDDGSLNADTGITVREVVVVDPTVAEPITAPEPAVVFKRDAGQNPTGIDTTGTLQTRISGACPPMQGGTYKVTLSYRFAYDNQTTDFISVFSFDGSPLTDRSNGETHRQEIKDSAGANIDGTGTNQVFAYTHVSVVTIAAGATPAVLLEWASGAAPNEASVLDDVIIVERIGP